MDPEAGHIFKMYSALGYLRKHKYKRKDSREEKAVKEKEGKGDKVQWERESQEGPEQTTEKEALAGYLIMTAACH